MQPLLSKPPIKPDECPIRYLTRVSEANGFLHFGYLLQHAELSQRNSSPPIKQLLEGRFDIHQYMEKLSLPVPVKKNPLKKIINDYQPNIHHPAILITTPKFCVKCIEKYGYAKNIWNILPILICPEHNLLLSNETRNGRKITWHERQLISNNGFKGINAKKFNGLIYLHDLINNKLNNINQDSQLHELFRHTNTTETISIINHIAFIIYKLEHSESGLLRNLKINDQFKLFNEASFIIKNWPNSFHDLLEKHHLKFNQCKSFSIQKSFKHIYKFIYKCREIEGYKLIFKEYEKFINTKQEYMRSSDLNRITHFSLKPQNLRYYNRKDVIKLLHTTSRTINKLIEKKTLNTILVNGELKFSKDDIDEHARKKSENLNFSQTMKLLNIPEKKLHKIIKNKLLIITSYPDKSNKEWSINKESILQFSQSN
ncbi:TniQ family protein [Marinicellulosiphila megalodicopiae]|uniref:TniQ family protein n=1 Tax=Marinicellulosiphila megalodicopiae TaxID=2724896 RepID=UPI003BB0CAF9